MHSTSKFQFRKERKEKYATWLRISIIKLCALFYDMWSQKFFFKDRAKKQLLVFRNGKTKWKPLYLLFKTSTLFHAVPADLWSKARPGNRYLLLMTSNKTLKRIQVGAASERQSRFSLFRKSVFLWAQNCSSINPWPQFFGLKKS